MGGGADGGGNSRVWGQQRGGGVGVYSGVGFNSWGGLQPLRTALHNHNYKSPKQFELKHS